ncbi:MAG: ChrR family anti-sigma-E factor [Rhodospirillaceae bacterium]|nr:ChrR family anti-sigma-E factor [Rhodospirillaceae bacterium]
MASEQAAKPRPRSHLSDDILTDYASGAADEALALLVASHLDYCPACRERLVAIEAVGGALLESLAPVPLERITVDSVLARIEAEDTAGGDPAGAGAEGLSDGGWLPAPLKPYVDGIRAASTADVEAWPWQALARGADMIDLPVSGRSYTALLLRLRAGTIGPRHAHRGNELVLVMCGSFADATGTYRCGDIAYNAPDSQHCPVAGREEDCICLVVMDAPLRMAGRLSRLADTLLRR